MPLPLNIFCGLSGWSYPHWNGVVYPKAKPRGFHCLEYLSEYFDSAEINTTFYQPLRPEIARAWLHKAAGNSRFLFTAKLHRRFTHDRVIDDAEVARFKEGLFPIHRARKLGCVLMQFPWTFRYTEENRAHVIRLRRAFHEFPLVVEMRHGSWTREEALGMLVDYRMGFCNIDQPAYTKATPPTAFLTSNIGYVRLHGRNLRDWQQNPSAEEKPLPRHDYLYSREELLEWKPRIENLQRFADRVFVFANNDVGGKSAVNALQLAEVLGDDRRTAPPDLLRRFAPELAGFDGNRAWQPDLFERAVA